MARILTGIQSSGKPHLGNILGAIQPGVRLSEDPANESLFFIADLHSLTTIKDASLIKENTRSVAAAWIACGFDTDKNIFYRQSRVPKVTELTWYLNCFTPYPMLANAHSFKDKQENLSDVNAGLFTYPVLMSADILLYDAEFVPVGKDQQQHLEMCRDIAQTFNHRYGEIFVIPEALIDEKVMTVPGIDGRKMSKSYGNTIDVFLPEKQLRKNVMKIVTDSTPMEEPKDPDTCTVFHLYSLVANESEITEMRANYTGGNYGYGHAKQALFEKLVETFREERSNYRELMATPEKLDHALEQGEQKANDIAESTLNRVRKVVGFS